MIASLGRRVRVQMAGVLLAAALPATGHAASLTLSPPSVAATYGQPIALTVSELTPGQMVLVETFLDINDDDAVNAGEPMVQCFMLTDGEAPSIGGVRNVNVPGDDDGEADGKIQASFRIGALAEVAQGVAKYVYRLSPVTGAFTPVIATFEIKQPDYPQEVTGTVTSGGAPVPFAYVFLITPEASGPILVALADANGDFTLKSEPGTYTLGAAKPGFVFDFSAAPEVTLAAGGMAQQDIPLIAATATIGGRLSDAQNGVGIPGVQVVAASGDPGLLGLAVTDPAGNFSIPALQAVADWGVEVSRNSTALLGYLSLADDYLVHTGGGSISGVSIQLPSATALVYGTLQNDQNQALPGVAVDTSNDQYHGFGLTDGTGYYVAGARAGDWHVEADSDDLLSRGYYSQGANVTLSGGQALQQDLTAYRFACVGDCNGNDVVTPDELVTMVSIALGTDGATACPYGLPDQTVTVPILVQAVNGCPR
jgi:hypothetical protein